MNWRSNHSNLLNSEIKQLQEENQKILHGQEVIMNKIGMQSKRISLIVRLIDDLKGNLEYDEMILN